MYSGLTRPAGSPWWKKIEAAAMAIRSRRRRERIDSSRERLKANGWDEVARLRREADLAQKRQAELEDKLKSMQAAVLADSGIGIPTLSVRAVRDIVADYYGIPIIEYISDRRHRDVVRPRQIGMYLARELTGRSLPAIGRMFGDKDHTTVLHACKTTESRMAKDDALAREVELLRAKCLAASSREGKDG